MKKGMKLGFGAAVLLAVGALVAQEQAQSLNTAAYWTKNAAVSDADGVLTVKGPKGVMLQGKKFTIDFTKKYTFKYTVQAVNATGKDVSLVFGGFNVFDKNGHQLNCHDVAVVAGTLTEVAADAAKGSKVITVKDGSKFKKGFYAVIGNAKEDLSDLPNRNYLGQVKAVEQKGEVWEITLAQPLPRSIKAGTKVREHSLGGYIYTAGVNGVGAKAATMRGTITGQKPGAWSFTAWPSGAVSAAPIILVNWNHKNIDTQLKDISLTVE